MNKFLSFSRLKKNAFLKYLGIFFLLIIVYTLFGVFSCSLPDKMVKHNIKMASNSMVQYGNYPRSVFDLEACQQDLFTEALILDIIYVMDRTKPLESAILVNKQMHSMVLTDDLWHLTHEEVDWEKESYARYWFGTSFLTRFLLVFFSYSKIQWLLFAASSLLLIFFFVTYYPLAGPWKTAAMTMSWVLVYGFMMMFSLQFTPIFIITLIASILIIKFKDNYQKISLLFFIIGSLTCYFDLLTIPLISFGWPLLVWLSLKDNNELIMKDLSWIFMWGCLWLGSFALTWASKWLIGSIVLDFNVFQNALDTVSMRTGTYEAFGRWDSIIKNMQMIPWTMVILTLNVFLVFAFTRFQRPSWLIIMLYFLIACLPYAWYFTLSNHTVIHFWFTYRLQVLTFAALLLALCSFRRPALK